jgi:hypothetical protein
MADKEGQVKKGAKATFGSRKFMAMFIASGLIVFGDLLGVDISENMAQNVSFIVVAYMVAQGWVDGKKEEAIKK